jgi:hypothetical protein
MLRRAEWMKWLPPIVTPSPSPMIATTLSFGLKALMPVA